MQYGNVKNYFFCIFLWKNLEIQGFIIIFAIACLEQRARNQEQRPNSLSDYNQ